MAVNEPQSAASHAAEDEAASNVASVLEAASQQNFMTPQKAMSQSTSPLTALPTANCSTDGGRRRVLFADVSTSLRGAYFFVGCMAILDGPKAYKNSRGREGVFCSFLLIDESARLRCVCFDAMATKLARLLERNKTYLLEHARVEALAADRDRDCTSFQLIIDAATIVASVTDGDFPDVPNAHAFDVPFSDCAATCATAKSARVDLLGICLSVERLHVLTRRDPPKTWQRRLIMLGNEAAERVMVALWGQQAVEFKAEQLHETLLLTDVSTTVDYGNRPLFSSSLLSCVVDITGSTWAESLDAYKNTWTTTPPEWTTISGRTELGGKPLNLKTILIAASAEPQGEGNWAYYDVMGTAHSWIALPQFCVNCPQCAAKCRKSSPRDYRCLSCGKCVSEAKTTIWANLQIADYSAVTTVTLFGDALATMLKQTPEAVHCEFLEKPYAHRAALEQLLCQEFLFRLNIRPDTYHGGYQAIVDVAIPLDAHEGRLLLHHIDKQIAVGLVQVAW